VGKLRDEYFAGENINPGRPPCWEYNGKDPSLGRPNSRLSIVNCDRSIVKNVIHADVVCFSNSLKFYIILLIIYYATRWLMKYCDPRNISVIVALQNLNLLSPQSGDHGQTDFTSK
jgi:hypothetical protein